MSKCRHEAWEHLPSGRRICVDCRASLSSVQPVTPDRLEEMAKELATALDLHDRCWSNFGQEHQRSSVLALIDQHLTARYEAGRREGAKVEQDRRDKCLYCDDTAKARYAVCYTHRNKPVWEEEDDTPCAACCGGHSEACFCEAAPKEEHREHPTDGYCIFCLAQWPCDEALEAER